jgi:hypothetical protein
MANSPCDPVIEIMDEPLAKPCFASGGFRCQVSGVRKNHAMLRLPET